MVVNACREFCHKKGINANHWELPRMLYQIWRFEPQSELINNPLVFMIKPHSLRHLVDENGAVVFSRRTVFGPKFYGKYDPSKVIFVNTDPTGRLVRTTSARIGEKDITFKHPPILVKKPSENFLYSVLRLGSATDT